ncbi:MAG: polymerase, sigma-24 subunit, subfamily [Acidobacteria bacterium]|nr:polymerase, sigma-24 subunit, subfamily [Acidobacteriota bacterium]
MTGDNEKESPVQLAAKALRPVAEPPSEPSGELEILFREHHKHLFSAAHRVTGSPADAEDVLQTVFLRLVKNHESYDLAENPQAYLSRAAINASLDLIRSRQRAKTVGMDETPAELMAVKSGNPETQHADRELQALIRQAVGRLGATAAEMFVLRYYEGHDNREIARLMGTSQMVVGVVLHRARTKLRKEIGHYLEKHHQ